MNEPAPEIKQFQEKVWDFYRDQGRDLPWRREVTPYGVFVSEVMLQQTQVSRVLERWPRWLRRFGGFEELAKATVADVLVEWQGMGYNRRALWLKAAAERVVEEFDGVLPDDPAVLVTLPGIGPNTAGSTAAFAYEVPTVFIETNIRRVFIHEFFSEMLPGAAGGIISPGERTHSGPSFRVKTEPTLAGGEIIPPAARSDSISDDMLRPLVAAALDREQPREWYWALMDYGSYLVKHVPNPNRRSRHYAVQSQFEGSLRQLRGEVLRRLLTGPKTEAELGLGDERLGEVLTALVKEGFVRRDGDHYQV